MSVISGPPTADHTAGSAPRSIATPCVKVCIVDGSSSLCLGCYRTLEEIGGWSGLTDVQRAQIMAELPARRDRIDPAKLGL
ncbi:MAG TPA: DUF1289 domain-containing protein [Brevundimonas sp.]|jgi:hypothetical protein